MHPLTQSKEAIAGALALRDLTDPREGPHALQLLVEDAEIALRNAWRCRALVHRGARIVSVKDNFDDLRCSPDSPARDPRETRYVTHHTVLRTHTTALIPGLLRQLAVEPPQDMLLVCPGIVYRRDRIDRLHVGEPHQLDLWRLRAGRRLTTESLEAMVRSVFDTLLPGSGYRAVPTSHPYTVDSLELEAYDGERWVEVGECGLAHPEVLERAGLDSTKYSALAMGLGLDRVLMLRNGIDDIRHLRSKDPRVGAQMLDLQRYQPVSNQPAVRRDLSIAVRASATLETLGDRVRSSLGDGAGDIEEVSVLGEWPYEELPVAARQRLGMKPEQKNVLLRIVFRSLDRSMTHEEANELRDQVYAALHEGAAYEWARVDARL